MKKKLYYIAILICLAVFVVSGIYLVSYFLQTKVAKSNLESLAEMRLDEEGNTDSGILKRYEKLYATNSQMIGWLTIEGTSIDYPVMQTKDDPEYYLYRNFNKKNDRNGLPFLDGVCDNDSDNDNLIVYGHHMKSGLMFATLMDYQSESFYKKHPMIQFDSLTERRKYKVVAAFYTKVYDKKDKDFKFYKYAGKLTRGDRQTFLENCRKVSIYDTGEKVGQEQLLTLATCSYHMEDGRFVVVARRMEE